MRSESTAGTWDAEAGRPHVWIVDDSALEADLARRALGPVFSCSVFSDGSAMLEALATGDPPDALLLDWHMPGMSGLEVTEFLRSKPATAQLPIVLLTGFRKTADVVRGLAAGANDYVIKPYAPEELTARVTTLIRTCELRDRAERAEALVGQLMEQLPEALLATDEAGIVRFVNRPAQALLGGGPPLVGRALGSVLPTLSLSPADGESDDAVVDVVIGGQLFAPAIGRLDLANLGRGYSITLRDVTAKRRAEHRRLDFYSIIAHDLRSPLMAIAMRAELLRRGARGPLTPAAVADLDKMSDRIDDLVALINDFLDLARIEGAGLKIETAPFDLNEVVAAVVDEFGPAAESARVALQFAPSAPAAIVGDSRRLRQVVTNLLANALKFTAADGHVAVAVEPSGETVELRVTDDGCGISDEALPSLFRRYSRAPSTSDVTGTGLGLLIVREIVDAHGGTVGATSEIGRGSSFWVRLPRA